MSNQFNAQPNEVFQPQQYQPEQYQSEKIIKSKKLIILGLLVIIGISAIGGFYFWKKRTQKYIKPTYRQVYRLVNEKISQSAPIVIYLPRKMNKQVAQKSIKFDPQIEGKWLHSENEKEIIFKPKNKLKLNRYYTVELALNQPEETTIKADFLVVEDPEIIAIFPKENSEVSENSEITIVFNRPMVPLTTLTELESRDVPVEITPVTEGKFKWVTTNTLQFIPKERLKRSSHYKVKVKSGLVSMDNLKVKGKERKFVTRRLKYLKLTQGDITYNQPISIYFNQPVDLEKTKKEIILRDLDTGEEIPFIAEYGSDSDWEKERDEEGGWIFGGVNFTKLTASLAKKFGFNWLFWQEQPEEKEKKEERNKSVIRIYNKADRFGRKKFWDFGNNYILEIKKAYPAEGDIILDEKATAAVHASGIIAEVSAESERTGYATPQFFDPQGKLWIKFYEEIDLRKSKYKISKLKDIGYGEKCKDENKEVSLDVECEKVPDKRKIFITFKDKEIGRGENLQVKFEKIVNKEGLTLNKEPVTVAVRSYPKFEVLRTFPGKNVTGASLTELVICSNSPIAVPPKKDYEKYFTANLDYELKYWSPSRRVDRYSKYEKCNKGEFSTTIGYGLIPLSDYSLELHLEDVFGQKLSYSLKFRTGQMSNVYRNFYHFQRSYNVTSPQKTKLNFAVQNMEYVNLEICRLEPLDFLYYLEKRLGSYDPPSSITRCQKIVRDKITLPERYWIKNYFQVDIKNYFEDPIGHYILTFYHPDYYYYSKYKRKRFQIYERSYLTVTNLAVTEKRINLEYATYGARKPLSPEEINKLNNLYWVTDLNTLEPISGAKVTLYRKSSEDKNSPLIFSGTYTTNEQGIALTDAVYGLRGAIISKGKDSTVIPSSESILNYGSRAFSAQKFYLYTDKPIYRPNSEVFIKGIYRVGYDGNYEIYRGKKVNLKVYNSKRDEILNKDFEVNDYGTFNTKLILDRKAPLGTYEVCADEYSCIYFDVQEYVPASFEVKIKSDKEEYVSKDTVNLEIEANYYFGVPLEGGEVTYTISSQNYYFDRYSDGYFNFGSSWYYWPPYSYGEKFILRGRTSLNSQGKAKISQSLDFEKLFKDKEERKSKIIVVDVTVKDSQGKSVSAQKSFIVHAGEFYLGLSTDKLFLGKNEKFNLRLKTVNTQGKGIKVKNINLSLYKVKWIYSKRLGREGGYHYKWEKRKELVKEYRVSTDKNGNYTQELKIDKEGCYEIEASARDKANNLVWTTYELYVYGEGAVSIRPTEETKLEVEAEKINLNVGEEGEIIIKSPYQKAKALISIERGKIFDYQIEDIKGNLHSFKFKVKNEYIPNIYVSVLLLSSKPEVKFGNVEFNALNFTINNKWFG